MHPKISSLSKALLVLAALMLIASLFVPLWSIYLNAPQYPEGLELQIWAYKIAGDIDIINGLNHYIGMKTLHSKDFTEFAVLPYIIVAYAACFLLVALTGRKKGLYILLAAFLLFGIVAMADFWKWEFDYGRNLDPSAAIKVPGMAYQPPLIGAKQLLNFYAYSIPAIGGWLFIGAGILALAAVLTEGRLLSRRHRMPQPAFIITLICVCGISCNSAAPVPITLHRDACDFCKMTISDGRFAAELVTVKGRVYKFDDLACMIRYAASAQLSEKTHYYISDFTEENRLTEAATAWYLQHELLRSPMGGNSAAFANRNAAVARATAYQTTPISWPDVCRSLQSQKSNNHDGLH
ncbi:nitrous oxide reductase accessory protein NosL [Niabella sp. CC-SYL272]|uniref:nitrous oxide reductase accessory protein NosL n=1 Tax=Niabella agricola TaxID=2891571 RepID=UPI001F426B70|nr:nitrous oxide reductase accessory protein NosL [Niabella agricola]MCF3108982.1 nitrous oxide reductase accessory protein NosL [Niabella agricola]